jgi:hypothetical protein
VSEAQLTVAQYVPSTAAVDLVRYLFIFYRVLSKTRVPYLGGGHFSEASSDRPDLTCEIVNNVKTSRSAISRAMLWIASARIS